eukprot:7170761-Prymnesium_polylepis.1
MLVGSPAWAQRWRRAASEPIDDALLDAIRCTVRQDGESADDEEDGRSSPQTERAVQVELLRLLTIAAPSAIRDANRAHAQRMRQALLTPRDVAFGPSRDDP